MDNQDDLSPSALRTLGKTVLDQVKGMKTMMIILFANDVIFIAGLLYLIFYITTAVK